MVRVAIIGAGALGSLVAGLLGLAVTDPQQDQILLVGKPQSSSDPHLKAMSDKGLIIEPALTVQNQLPLFKDGARVVKNVQIVDHPSQVKGCELAIILVKSYRTYEAGNQVLQALVGGGVVLSLQNGLGNLEALQTVPGLAQSYALAQGVTTIGAVLEEPGRVRFSGVGSVSLPLLEATGNQRLEWLKDCFEKLGLPVTLSAEVESLIWGKLVVNCAGNAITALLDLSNAALLANPPAWEIALEAGQEVAELARLKGIKLPYPYEEAANQIKQVIELNPTTYSSMCQSVRQGRPTEIEALNGAVVREAEKLDYPVPVNRTLAQLIRALQVHRSEQGVWGL